jgi:hypothetical protein
MYANYVDLSIFKLDPPDEAEMVRHMMAFCDSGFPISYSCGRFAPA